MDQIELMKKVAYLEFVNDQLITEIKYMDTLLKSIGFPEGLATVKIAAHELMKQEREEQSSEGEQQAY